jgi:hypothetical protein
MHILRSPFVAPTLARARTRALRLLLSAIFLTACADDDRERDELAVAMCGEAGCDSGDDAVVREDDGAVSPEPSPDSGDETPVSDTGTAGDRDAGASEQDASSDTSDAGSEPAVDAGNSDAQVSDAAADAGTTALDAGTGSDASSQLDAGASADANAPLDANTSSDAGSTLDANTQSDAGPPFVPVRFSASDHGASALLSEDRLSVENRGELWGNARSDAVIAPGSGVFYFEAQRVIESLGGYGVGIATAAASLNDEVYASAAYKGLSTDGSFTGGPATCTGALGFQDAENKFYYGFVVDYRGSTARLHYVLDDGAGGVEVTRSCTTTLSGPIYILYTGARWEVGFQMRINTGADTTNHPFHFSAAQVRAALNAVSESGAANALVLGFARTRALPLSASPVLSVTPAADFSVTAGVSVMLTATASDAEEGNLTSSIRWRDLSTQHHAPLTGTGGSFSFTAGLGRHPIFVSVRDSVGRTVTRTVIVNATGSLPRANPARMVVDDLSDPSTTLIAPDGLRVDVRATAKKGVRCNQGIYGQYWYFEATRNGPAVNEGVGLMIREGSLDPYDFVNVPWSMSINLLGSSWYNLNWFAEWDSANTRYGFAVDYRGIHPIVHIIIGGQYHRTLRMKDVWTPLYPIVYGNPSYSPPSADPGYDITVNFGASAFQFGNPAAILQGAGIDTSGLVLGWGL